MAAEVLDEHRDPGAPTPLELRDRPWHVLSGRLNARLDELVATDVWSMDEVETAETIVELQRAQARLAAAQARLLAHAEVVGVAELVHATSTAGWLRSQVPLTPRQATRAVELAGALESGRYAATAAALAAGELMPDQAQVIVAAVDALPNRLYAEDRARGEAHLVELARTYDAQQLRRLGRHLLEVVDPDIADEELGRQLEAEEAAAALATSLTMVDDGRGRAHGRFTIPSLQGEMLRKLLQGFANPQVPDPIPRKDESDSAGGSRRRLAREVLGDALVRLIEAYPAERVPASGGLNATVVVTMPVETLRGGLGRATVTGTGTEISGAAARRLACAAGVVPAVLDGRSRVLDLGRRSRLATSAQRLAKLIEQKGLCAVEHCDRPASWADAHHWKKRWVDGGTTNLADLVLICPRHHTLAHLPGRTVQPVEGGRYRIHHQT